MHSGLSLPELFGGSADLTGSNNTNRKDSRVWKAAEPSGNYLHYGVREFGMAAIMNGIALAWRIYSLRRNVPGVFRLRAQCACACRP